MKLLTDFNLSMQLAQLINDYTLIIDLDSNFQVTKLAILYGTLICSSRHLHVGAC